MTPTVEEICKGSAEEGIYASPKSSRSMSCSGLGLTHLPGLQTISRSRNHERPQGRQIEAFEVLQGIATAQQNPLSPLRCSHLLTDYGAKPICECSHGSYPTVSFQKTLALSETCSSLITAKVTGGNSLAISLAGEAAPIAPAWHNSQNHITARNSDCYDYPSPTSSISPDLTQLDGTHDCGTPSFPDTKQLKTNQVNVSNSDFPLLQSPADGSTKLTAPISMQLRDVDQLGQISPRTFRILGLPAIRYTPSAPQLHTMTTTGVTQASMERLDRCIKRNNELAIDRDKYYRLSRPSAIMRDEGKVQQIRDLRIKLDAITVERNNLELTLQRETLRAADACFTANQYFAHFERLRGIYNSLVDNHEFMVVPAIPPPQGRGSLFPSTASASSQVSAMSSFAFVPTKSASKLVWELWRFLFSVFWRHASPNFWPHCTCNSTSPAAATDACTVLKSIASQTSLSSAYRSRECSWYNPRPYRFARKPIFSNIIESELVN